MATVTVRNLPDEVHRALRVRGRHPWIDGPAVDRRVLPFDLDASQAYATLMAGDRAAGKAIDNAGGYIAAIAAALGFAVATRDVGPFRAAGVAVVNPCLSKNWQREMPVGVQVASGRQRRKRARIGVTC
jgi:hypothetical protein